MDRRDFPTDPLDVRERQWVRQKMQEEERSQCLWLATLCTIIVGGLIAILVWGIRWPNLIKQIKEML